MGNEIDSKIFIEFKNLLVLFSILKVYGMRYSGYQIAYMFYGEY